MSNFNTGSGTVDYQTVRQAMAGEPFTMSLVDPDEIQAVVTAVNEGIDAHLEICNSPDRGDWYSHNCREIAKTEDGTYGISTLECSVSPMSMPTLLRRLCESDLGDAWEAGLSLATSILLVLGINEYGKFVGREALGLD